MNYVEFHLGDYAAATAHLSWDEDAAYMRLLRAYYHSESPIPADLKQAFRLARATTPAQRQAVETVLQEFFDLRADGWHQKRCDAEIERATDKKEKAKRSASARWAAQPTDSERTANAMRTHMRTHTEGNAPNLQTPDTRHQGETGVSPKHSPPAKPAATLRAPELVAEGVDPQAAADWLTLRKAKRLPLTPTAWTDTKAEAAKAGMTPAQAVSAAVSNNWAGFKASWLAPAAQPAARNGRQPAMTKDQRDAEAMQLLGWPLETNCDVIEVTR